MRQCSRGIEARLPGRSGSHCCGGWAALRSGVRVYDLFALFYALLIVPYPYVSTHIWSQ